MTKFKRPNYKGEITKDVLYRQLRNLLISYVPREMYHTEIKDFNDAIESIAKDFEKVENGNFQETFDKIIEQLRRGEPDYQQPNLDFLKKEV